jgi:hypothetical protein
MTYLTHFLAYTVGLAFGVCGVLIAMSNTGRCSDCPQHKDGK